jgi:hypothetical protein
MPLFSREGDNYLWAIETDDFLRIRKFVPFLRESEAVESLLSPEGISPFRKGDYAPIPIWLNGHVHLIPGGISIADLAFELPPESEARQVSLRLSGILTRARHKEVIAHGQPESFWQALRFLSQNFSGGAGWLRRLRTVLDQAEAFLRSDAVERGEIRLLLWRWTETYLPKVGLDIAIEFFGLLIQAQRGLLAGDDLIAVAFLGRLLSGNEKRRFLEIGRDLGLPEPGIAFRALEGMADPPERIRRFLLTFEPNLSMQVERCFNAMESNMLAFLEHVDDFLLLVELFGPIPLPNEIRFRVPVIVKSHFEQARSVESELARLRAEQPRSPRIGELEGRLQRTLQLAESFSRMVGGDRGVQIMREAYNRGV